MDHLTVSALNRYVKLLLETNDVLSSMTVLGEISNLSINRFSGHMYFSLKDEAAAVRAVCFKNAADRLRFIPKDGMNVLAFGRISLYERDGQYQLIVEDILPQGAGAQNRYLEELKTKLQKEGIFDEGKKRSLVKYPKSIAVVTASGSAALADIINVISRRYPVAKLTVFPVLVQGLQAETSIVEALQAIEATGSFDTAIVARGGGSKEDLYAFSSEAVVRAASKLSVPFISAVGHETDIPLLDYVADVRAPTPSAAAELAVPNIFDLMDLIHGAYANVLTCVLDAVSRRKEALRDRAEHCTNELEAYLEEKSSRLQKRREDAFENAAKKLQSSRTMLSGMAAQLHGLSPLNVLSRGYAYTEKDGEHIGSVKAIKPDDLITVSYIDGKTECTVNTVKGKIDGREKNI